VGLRETRYTKGSEEDRVDLSFLLLTKHYSVEKIKKNETGEAFACMGERCIQSFRGET